MGSTVTRRWGLIDQELLALPPSQTSPLFSELDTLVLDHAAGMSRAPIEIPDQLFDKLRRHLDAGQLVELTHHVALEDLRGRFNLALGIGSPASSMAWCALSPRCRPAIMSPRPPIFTPPRPIVRMDNAAHRPRN